MSGAGIIEIDPKYVAVAQRTWRTKRPSFDTDDIVIAIDNKTPDRGDADTREATLARYATLPEEVKKDQMIVGMLAVLREPAPAGYFHLVVLSPDGIAMGAAFASVPIPPPFSANAN